MEIKELIGTIDRNDVIREMRELMLKFHPICRSITGKGFRDTLKIIQDYIPLEICDIPTGTKVFDWVVPKEWNITDAYVRDSKGKRVIDFFESNLHVVGYSVPVRKKMTLPELKKHVFTLPDHPDWIPYRTSYYEENWGFCLSQKKLDALPEDLYEVCIEATLEKGFLTYGEFYRKGSTSDEVLLSCHACHPSLCNDNISGMVLVTILAKYLSLLPLRYSYRIIFIPGTIGSITWLSKNESRLFRIKHGLVVACVGDPGKFTYKRSRIGDAEIDKIVEHVLKCSTDLFEIVDFSPYGYDERQYCSPGINLPIGCLHRTSHGQYPQYHTSADDFDLVKPENICDSLFKYFTVVKIIENNKTFLNMNPKCEPQLGKRGLYRAIGGKSNTFVDQMALLWVLNLSDGKHTLLDISERSGIDFDLIKDVADILQQKNLLHVS